MADVVNAFVNSQELRARRAVRHLRRVGRVLRPRPPAARPRRPRQHRPRERLRADGLPHAGGRRLPVRAPRQKKWPWERDRYGWHRNHFESTTGVYGHESILKFISYRFGLGDLNTRMKFANNIGRSFDFWRPRLRAPQAARPARDRHPAVRAGGRRRARQPGGARERPRRHRARGRALQAARLRGQAGRHLHAAGHDQEGRPLARPGRPGTADGLGSAPMETRLLIRGEQVAGEGPALEVENPATEETLTELGTASPEQLDAAIAGAREAARGWGATPAVERAELLHEVAARMRALHRRPRQGDDARGRQAADRELGRGRLDRRRVRLLRGDGPQLRRPRDPVDRGDAARAGRQGAARRVGRDRALELPAAAVVLEARPGAGRGQRGRRQAVGADPGLDPDARRVLRGPAGRGRQPGRGRRRRGRGSGRGRAHRRRGVHRLGGDRQEGRGGAALSAWRG